MEIMGDLTLNDFFCGAGGMGLGFKQAGFDIVGAWDFDKYAVQTYRHNIGEHVQQRDIKEMRGSELPHASIWTFGFPCTDLSIAGKMAGMIKGKTRSGLFYEVMRLLDEVKSDDPSRLPELILAENVKGLKKYLATMQEEYNHRGYEMYYTLYNSKYGFSQYDIKGLPQNRERYFVIGIRQDIQKVFNFPEQSAEHPPKLSTILEDEVDEKFYIDEKKTERLIAQIQLGKTSISDDIICINPRKVDGSQTYQQDRIYDVDGVSTALSSSLSGRTNIVETEPHLKFIGGLNEPRLKNGKHFSRNYRNQDRVYDSDGISPTLNAAVQTNIVEGPPKINVIGRIDMKGQDNIRRVYDTDGISPTLTASEGGHRQPKILASTGLRVRKLTPREYARAQGFSDDFEQIVSDSQFYKQMGNAVSVPIARGIALAIKDFLES